VTSDRSTAAVKVKNIPEFGLQQTSKTCWFEPEKRKTGARYFLPPFFIATFRAPQQNNALR